MIRENKVEKLMSGISIHRGKLPSRRAHETAGNRAMGLFFN